MPLLDDPVGFTLRVPKQHLERARALAKLEGLTIAVLLRRLLLQWIITKEQEQNNAN